ncbi:MAG: hypothetical protein ACJ768_15005 [Gaiellaceae bacterium]
MESPPQPDWVSWDWMKARAVGSVVEASTWFNTEQRRAFGFTVVDVVGTELLVDEVDDVLLEVELVLDVDDELLEDDPGVEVDVDEVVGSWQPLAVSCARRNWRVVGSVVRL